MTTSLFRFDDKYISAAQAIMVDNRVLEGFIHNLSKSSDIKIRGYLLDTRFLHVSPLQLGLPMDGPVVTASAVVPNKEDLCEAFLGNMSNKFYDVVFMGLMATTISTFSSKRPIYVSIGDKNLSRNNFGQLEYMGRECVIDIVHDDGNARIKSSDATVWLEAINSTATARHKSTAQAGYAREKRRELIRLLQKYMPWFRVASKLYLLSMEARSRQLRQKRQRRSSQKRRFGKGATTSSSPAPTQHAPLMSMLHCSQFTPLIPVHFTNPGTFIPTILRPYANVDADTNAEPNASTSTIYDGDTNCSDLKILARALVE
ncbi:hypothetical protein Golob_003708, partial [Gossypium lobatum]|nr:hypothetical protein [Gossypium lobatum]